MDQAGREFGLGEAFLQHVLAFNRPEIGYFAFDFHNYCRAMRFENVGSFWNSILVVFTVQAILPHFVCQRPH